MNRCARLVLAACLALATMTVGLSSPASAASTERCVGLNPCENDVRYGTFGYIGAYTTSHWNQNKGHNCTNYVAYRLTHNGRITARVPETTNAGNWDNAVRRWTRWGATVHKSPIVGDIAYWEGGYHGAGKQGHVAYVEKVWDNGAIDVSEDNASGTFRWVKYSGGNAPSGYLRFKKSIVSPRGQLTTIRSPRKNQLKQAGFFTDADAYGAPVPLRVRIYSKNKKSFKEYKFSTTNFLYSRTFYSAFRGKRLVRTYADNAGGLGKDSVLIDSRYVKIK